MGLENPAMTVLFHAGTLQLCIISANTLMHYTCNIHTQTKISLATGLHTKYGLRNCTRLVSTCNYIMQYCTHVVDVIILAGHYVYPTLMNIIYRLGVDSTSWNNFP